MTTFPYYAKGLGTSRSSARAADIATLSMRDVEKPAGYVPSPELAKAVNAALILGRPLLVTGEPGTGKTQLAYSIAHEIGAGAGEAAREVPVHKFETKSTSVARDLFYSYDAIAAFRTEPGQPIKPIEYVTYQALGRAIIEAYDRDKVERLLPNNTDRYDHPGEARRSVVLIDEIDKAPRDFPNDLLNEIDRMHFRVAEADYEPTPGAREANAVSFADNMRPIVIITSNSEKALPDPFLRRCVFHHIPFPTPQELEEIVDTRFQSVSFPSGLRRDAIRLFWELRGNSGGLTLAKPPSTAELLDFLQLLYKVAEFEPGTSHGQLFENYFGSLIKNTADREKVGKFIAENWR